MFQVAASVELFFVGAGREAVAVRVGGIVVVPVGGGLPRQIDAILEAEIEPDLRVHLGPMMRLLDRSGLSEIEHN